MDFTSFLYRKNIFFADTPHLLKLIRNWLLDTGFVSEDGTKISKWPLHQLVEHQTEISAIYKISIEHLECTGATRQRVSLAAQLLSHSVAETLIRHKKNDGDQFEMLGQFIETVNDWFDVMNSYQPSNNVLSKSAFGNVVAYDTQLSILDKMDNLIENMRCTNRENILTFQEDILMSINSIKNLFIELKNEYPLSYILTHKLNQDVL